MCIKDLAATARRARLNRLARTGAYQPEMEAA
jgi:hypothetical protein